MSEQWQSPGGRQFTPPPGYPSQGGQVEQQPQGMRVPQGGAFALSETMPMIQQAAALMEEARQEWLKLRTEADQKKAHAKKVRADLIVQLRVFGNEMTGDRPIKTSAERNEWANADGDVQQAELEADLAQTVQMAARESYDDKQGQFDALRSALSMEKEMLSREYSGPHNAP